MAKRNMRFDGDEILRKKSKTVDSFDKKLHMLLDDMAETLEAFNGVGLAAVQVGILKRVFIVDVGDGITEFINPQILTTDGEQVGAEGCLSFPGEYGIVSRPNRVKVRAQNRMGKWFEAEGEELFARAIFHENDHLDGIVFKDHATRMLSDEELEDEDED
ncbi:MAG: peptide deformylase [Angelakisella sp.]